MQKRICLITIALCLGTGLFMVQQAFAHCDTLEGPVVQDARLALEKGEVTPVLKWVTPENEADIREAFRKTIVVRKQSADARDLADMYFFETLVRIHREGEGAPYTGLKPAGEVEPGIAAADKALESGSADALVQELSAALAASVRKQFEQAAAAKKHADESVEAGREYVEAYVTFIHYVERLNADITRWTVPEAGGEWESQPEGGHQH